jgi:NADH dehydrogenase [ubiquinone] 1 alpha subcomplex assembly factor 7
MDPADSSPGEAERVARLHLALREAERPDGFLPFDRFVEIALHHPTDGFYSTRRTLGPAGDFYTAAHVHAVFGRTLAYRVLEEFERLGRPAQFRVVEVGPGDGTLARDLLGELRGTLPGTTRLTYHLVEPSAALRATAAERLQRLGDVRLSESLGADGPFEGVVIANELLDAVPFRRLVRRGSGWSEIGVRWTGGRWEWAEAPAGSVPEPPLPSYAAEGTIVEISPVAEAFLRETADHLEGGSAILLDYGASEEELVRGRPSGTLAAVRGHRVVDDPLDRPGTSDLSAFVNFTRIRFAAKRSGLSEVAFGSQREALVRWGIERAVMAAVTGSGSAEAEVRTRLAVKNLLFGFENFQVLELRPGLTG